MSARLRWAAALLGVLATPGCAAERRPPPLAPALASPNDAIPPDLDLVIRVDLGRVRAGLGPDAVSGLRKNALGAQTAETSDPWIAEALERSEVALLALRPEFGAEGPDNVLILTGQFADVLPLGRPPAGWRAPVDLGGDVRRFDRATLGVRSSPVRFYAFGSERLVFVSVAEIDSVEAVLERGRPATRLRPKASGLLSFQARLRDARRLLGERFPILAKLLGGSQSVAGSVDVSGDNLVADLGLELVDDGQAREAAAALDALAQALAETEGRAGLVARNAKVQAAGRFIGVRLELGRNELSGLWR